MAFKNYEQTCKNLVRKLVSEVNISIEELMTYFPVV